MRDVYFKYGWIPKLRVVISIIFLCLTIFADFMAIQDGRAKVMIFTLAFTIFAFLMTIMFAIAWSDVVVNSDEIASVILGRKWKSIRWADVTTVTVTYPPDFQGGRDTMYWIGTAATKQTYVVPSGRLMFTKAIRNLDALIQAINENTKGRHIEFSEAISGTLGGGLGKSTFRKLNSL